MRVALVFVIALLMPVCASAQALTLFDIDATAFPVITAKFYAFDASGQRVNRSSTELGLKENGAQRTILSTSCPPIAPSIPISSVVTIDVSGSMSGGQGAQSNIDIAKAAGHAWIAMLAAESECAITSFDDHNYINQDFTTSKAKLTAAVDALTSGGGTSYDLGLLLPVGGALVVMKNAKKKKVVMFLTDGKCREITESSIISEAKAQNCAIYVVTLGMTCPDALRNVSAQTGGAWFENITSVEQAEEVYEQIVSGVQSGEPCSISWESISCPDGARIVVLSDAATDCSALYELSDSVSSRLEFEPRNVLFRSKAVGTAYDTTVVVTAVNGAFSVLDVVSSNPEYSVAPKSFSIAAGQSITLTVSYSPLDSAYTYAEFDFITNLCSNRYYASGTYPGKRAKAPSLKIIAPNGGEVFVVGTQANIVWNGIPATDNVKLEYSTDNGSSWHTITDLAMNPPHLWTVPNTPSAVCLVRATHGNNMIRPHITLIGHTKDVVKVSWSPDGLSVATGGSDGYLKIWDATDGTLLHSLSVITGGGVLDLDWSSDNSYVAVSGNYGRASIWNAISGNLEHTLSGHTDDINQIRWNRQGTHLATASRDRTKRIWDASTGAEISSLTVAGYDPFSVGSMVAWNALGTQVAGGFGDRCVVWDALTGIVLDTFQGHFDDVNLVEWSPTQNKVASASRDLSIKVWDPVKKLLEITVVGHKNSITAFHWSPDGSRLAASGDNDARVWDATKWDSAFAIVQHDSIVNDVSWGTDGRTIATAGADGKGIVWDAKTAEKSNELIGHRGEVLSIAYSPNGLYLATSSRDFTAIIWRPFLAVSMSDTSDAVFAIVRPQPTAIDVDMRRVVIGGIKDSVVSSLIMNTGSFDFTIDSVSISGPNASPFSLVSGHGTGKIASGSSRDVEFEFQPTSLGTVSATIQIHTTAGVLTQRISGEGVAENLEVVGGLIDFGKVIIGDKRSLSKMATVKNIGALPISITSIRKAGPNDIDFDSPSIGIAFILAPDSTKLIDLSFTPSDSGRTMGRLFFDYIGDGTPASMILYGEGIATLPKTMGAATLHVGSGTAKSGEIVTIPITLVSDSNLANTGAASFTGQLRFNATLLEPLSPLVLGPLTGNEGVVDVSMSSTADASGVLATLQFRAALGNDSTCILSLENMQAVGGNVAITSEPGQFTLDGICLAGGPRLLNPNGSIDLVSTGQNPILTGFTEVTLETSEVGRTSLVLRDMRGCVVKTFIDGEVGSGRRVIVLDVGDVASGTYMLTLRTPTEQRTIRIEVAP